MSRLRRSVEPFLRRLLHFYWRFSRGITLGVRAIVINSEGHVFLVKHSYVNGWHLPGGGVEPGETLVSALERELAEEGNIAITARPQLHAMFFNAHVSSRDHVALFVVRDFRQPSAPVPNHEIVAAGFFAIEALPSDTTAGTRARIAEVMLSALPSERW